MSLSQWLTQLCRYVDILKQLADVEELSIEQSYTFPSELPLKQDNLAVDQSRDSQIVEGQITATQVKKYQLELELLINQKLSHPIT